MSDKDLISDLEFHEFIANNIKNKIFEGLLAIVIENHDSRLSVKFRRKSYTIWEYNVADEKNHSPVWAKPYIDKLKEKAKLEIDRQRHKREKDHAHLIEHLDELFGEDNEPLPQYLRDGKNPVKDGKLYTFDATRPEIKNDE